MSPKNPKFILDDDNWEFRQIAQKSKDVNKLKKLANESSDLGVLHNLILNNGTPPDVLHLIAKKLISMPDKQPYMLVHLASRQDILEKTAIILLLNSTKPIILALAKSTPKENIREFIFKRNQDDPEIMAIILKKTTNVDIIEKYLRLLPASNIADALHNQQLTEENILFILDYATVDAFKLVLQHPSCTDKIFLKLVRLLKSVKKEFYKEDIIELLSSKYIVGHEELIFGFVNDNVNDPDIIAAIIKNSYINNNLLETIIFKYLKEIAYNKSLTRLCIKQNLTKNTLLQLIGNCNSLSSETVSLITKNYFMDHDIVSAILPKLQTASLPPILSYLDAKQLEYVGNFTQSDIILKYILSKDNCPESVLKKCANCTKLILLDIVIHHPKTTEEIASSAFLTYVRASNIAPDKKVACVQYLYEQYGTNFFINLISANSFTNRNLAIIKNVLNNTRITYLINTKLSGTFLEAVMDEFLLKQEDKKIAESILNNPVVENLLERYSILIERKKRNNNTYRMLRKAVLVKELYYKLL